MKKAHSFYEEKYITRVISVESIISCFCADYPHPFYYSGEFHPFWEIVCVTDGSVSVAADEKVYTLSGGDVIFHKPMEFHRLWSVDDGGVHVFTMAFRAQGPLCQSLENAALKLSDKQMKQLNQIIQFADSAFHAQNRQYHKRILESHADLNGSVQTFVNMFENFLIGLNPSQRLLSGSTEDSHICEIYRTVIARLNASVYGDITLAELAEQCNFSVSQLKRVFARYSDIGIHKYYMKLKIAEAIKLLGQNTDISTISSMLAFSNQNYFSSAFKRETGMSPTQYKKNILEIKN